MPVYGRCERRESNVSAHGALVSQPILEIVMIYALLGAAFAVAGVDKLAGDNRYEEMFDDLGWTRQGMGAVTMAEVTGGVLLGLRRTRRVGAALLAGSSAAVLASELRDVRPGWRGRAGSCCSPR